MRRSTLTGLGCALVLAGCSGVSPTQVGQTTGTLAGAAIAPGVGAPLGALVGTLAGLVIEHQVDKVRQKKERVELHQQLQAPPIPQAPGSSADRLGGPSGRVWVDERLDQGRLVAGHFELRAVP